MKKLLAFTIALVVLFSFSASDAQARPNYQVVYADMGMANAFFAGMLAGSAANLGFVGADQNYKPFYTPRGGGDSTLKPFYTPRGGGDAANKWILDPPIQRMDPIYDPFKGIHD